MMKRTLPRGCDVFLQGLTYGQHELALAFVSTVTLTLPLFIPPMVHHHAVTGHVLGCNIKCMHASEPDTWEKTLRLVWP